MACLVLCHCILFSSFLVFFLVGLVLIKVHEKGLAGLSGDGVYVDFSLPCF